MTTPHTLEQLYVQHDGKISDKWSIYIREYERLFAPYRGLELALLEIGVQNGGSLEIWGKYFQSARSIVGCEIDEECRKLEFSDPRISLVIGDANSDEAECQIAMASEIFDLIIDDSSHHSADIVRAFFRYFPRVADGGLYVVEDLHCSYWQEFEGGIFDHRSSMAFLKSLADVVNHEHWGLSHSRTEFLEKFSSTYSVTIEESLLAEIHSIEFVNSLCFIRKAEPSMNQLGPRVVAGIDAPVQDAMVALQSTLNDAPPQQETLWAAQPKTSEPIDRSTQTPPVERLKALQEQTALLVSGISELKSNFTLQLGRFELQKANSEERHRSDLAKLVGGHQQEISHHLENLESANAALKTVTTGAENRLKEQSVKFSEALEREELRARSREDELLRQLDQWTSKYAVSAESQLALQKEFASRTENMQTTAGERDKELERQRTALMQSLQERLHQAEVLSAQKVHQEIAAEREKNAELLASARAELAENLLRQRQVSDADMATCKARLNDMSTLLRKTIADRLESESRSQKAALDMTASQERVVHALVETYQRQLTNLNDALSEQRISTDTGTASYQEKLAALRSELQAVVRGASEQQQQAEAAIASLVASNKKAHQMIARQHELKLARMAEQFIQLRVSTADLLRLCVEMRTSVADDLSGLKNEFAEIEKIRFLR